MRLSLKLLGFEIASLYLEGGDEPAAEEVVRKVSKPVKLISRLWVAGMIS
ncbi:hypothetical protein MycrhDRAFT_5761 [Mycolicibacterium rhodesiae JS60]|nr:hypothetical protein MycrhDRAFT_5761 [Mycolicibacterium rhodesiae JS60]